jgi:hypothetical protein
MTLGRQTGRAGLLLGLWGCAGATAPLTAGTGGSGAAASSSGSTSGTTGGTSTGSSGSTGTTGTRPDAGPYFIGAIVSFDAGPGAGFGAGKLPDVIEGPPEGGGMSQGSLDVLSLGTRGVIVVEMAEEIVDGPGPDLTIFENAFLFGDGKLYSEPAAVAVSEDGVDFTEFPCDPDAGAVATCAGVHAVFSAPGNGISPLDPSVSGGDPLDLAAIGVPRARYVRIRDLGMGSRLGPAAGFDLDAIANLHPAP